MAKKYLEMFLEKKPNGNLYRNGIRYTILPKWNSQIPEGFVGTVRIEKGKVIFG